MATRNTYDNLFQRLVANTHEPAMDTGCWMWKLHCDRWGYARLNVYVPGLGRVVKVMAHIAAWVWLHWECETADDMWLGYCELQASGLELDHGCEREGCINPDCVVPATPVENCARRDANKRACASL